MKAFVIYTLLRLGLFVLTYVVFGGIWLLVVGTSGSLLWPFLAAIVVSSLLSLKFLAPQRERFASVVQHRAEKATARFEEIKAKEDAEAQEQAKTQAEAEARTRTGTEDPPAGPVTGPTAGE